MQSAPTMQCTRARPALHDARRNRGVPARWSRIFAKSKKIKIFVDFQIDFSVCIFVFELIPGHYKYAVILARRFG